MPKNYNIDEYKFSDEQPTQKAKFNGFILLYFDKLIANSIDKRVHKL